MRILVTGGAGYIGPNLVDRLRDEGHETTALGNLTTGKARQIQHRLGRIRSVNGSILDAALAGFSHAMTGEVVNLGNPRETTILQLAEMIRGDVGSSSPVQPTSYESHYGPGFADTRRRVPDVSPARDPLGWEPTTALVEGLGRTHEWWKQTHGADGG